MAEHHNLNMSTMAAGQGQATPQGNYKTSCPLQRRQAAPAFLHHPKRCKLPKQKVAHTTMQGALSSSIQWLRPPPSTSITPPHQDGTAVDISGAVISSDVVMHVSPTAATRHQLGQHGALVSMSAANHSLPQ